MALDVTIRDEGSLILLEPATDAAREWFDEHIGADNGYQPMWPTVVVESRYAGDILEGLIGDGLTIGRPGMVRPSPASERARQRWFHGESGAARIVVAAILAATLIGGTIGAATATAWSEDRATRTVYVRQTGTLPYRRLVVRPSCNAEDAWSVVHPAEYTSTRVVLSCVGRF